MIYLDNAATSHPKPPEVLAAMARYLREAGNPGRAGHAMAEAAEQFMWDARAEVAGFFGGDDPARVVFTLNATMALNLAIKGVVHPGDRILTSAFEHNSVVRPLHALREHGVQTIAIPPAPDSPIDLGVLEGELRHGGVRVIVVNHASNVTGSVIPLGPIRSLAEHYDVPLVVDAAQTAGHAPVAAKDADVLVFAGHKGLLGPQGTGGLYVSDRVRIQPILQGGTGSRSEDPNHPRWLPQSLEAGTPNGVGVAGLAAGVRHVAEVGLTRVRQRERQLRRRLVDALSAIPTLRIHEWPSTEPPVGVVSATFAGPAVEHVAALLEERYDILVRSGLHCAAAAHRTLGTLDTGTVRFSLSHVTTEADVDRTAAAVLELVEEAQPRRVRVPAGPSHLYGVPANGA